VKWSCVEIGLQSSDFVIADACEEKCFTSRYTLCLNAVELFRSNILVNFIPVILIWLFQSSGYIVFISPEFYQNWTKTSSVREVFDLKVFVINVGIIRTYILQDYYLCNLNVYNCWTFIFQNLIAAMASNSLKTNLISIMTRSGFFRTCMIWKHNWY